MAFLDGPGDLFAKSNFIKRVHMKTQQPDQFDDVAFRKSLSSEQAFDHRTQKGMQPVIDIAGYPYYLNVRWNILEPRLIIGEMKVRPTIHLDKDCFYDDQTDKFVLYYDTKRQEPFDVPTGITTLPKNVVFVKIPNTYEADPVGMAREDGKSDPRYYLEKFPIQLHHTAEIIELKNSPLMDEIKANKAKQSQHRSPRRRVDPGPQGKKKS